MVGHQLGGALVAIIKPLLSGNMAKQIEALLYGWSISFASCNTSSIFPIAGIPAYNPFP